MCSMSVLCPLCAQTSFSSIDAFIRSLIKAANGPLSCPICNELFLGLDKLTIHLFSHTNIMMNANDSINIKKAAAVSINSNGNEDECLDAVKQQQKATSNEVNFQSVLSQTHVKEAMVASANINDHSSEDHVRNEKLKEKEELNLDAMNEIQKQRVASNEGNCENVQLLQPVKEEYLLCPPATSTIKKSKISKTDAKRIIKKTTKILALESETKKDTQQQPTPAVVDSLPSLATCDICEFTFRNEELRDMHVRLVHQSFAYLNRLENSNSNCLESPQLNVQQAEPDFKCHLCSKTFKMKGSLRVHLKVVHLMGLPYVNNTPKLNICDRIRHKESKQLKASTSADSPTSSHTSNNMFSVQPIALIPTMSTSTTLISPSSMNNAPASSTEYQQKPLENCNSTFNSNVLLVFNSSHNLAPLNATLIGEETFSNPNTTAVLAATSNPSDNPKIWECDVCSKAFTTKYFLKKHKRLHTGEMPYTCEICARTFTFQQSYHKHLLYHSDEKPHVCSTCGRAFKELSTLHNHERIHSGEKPFKCDVCGKSFRQRVSFLVHTRIHTGVMPYKCDLCQKSFRYKVSQRTHKCQPASNEDASLENDTLDQISENFIKTFLENSAQLQHPPPQNSPASNEIATINEKMGTPPSSTGSPPSTLNEHQVLLSKTIDDIVVESCNKLGIGNANDSFRTVENINEGSMSPSQKLQNMRLYSPEMVTPDLNGFEGDLTRFFLEHSSGGQNVL